MPSANLLFIVSEAPACKRWPKWKRTLILDEAAGTLYAPACACPAGETAALLCCTWDGGDLLEHGGHAFLSVDWLEQEYPEWADVYAAFRQTMRRALAPAR